MSPVIETEQDLTDEALHILQQTLPPHKVARLLSIWHVGQGDAPRNARPSSREKR